MKSIFRTIVIAIVAIAFFSTLALAQQFNFSKGTHVYAQLSGATSLTNGNEWTSDSTFSAPIGFNFKLGNSTYSTIYLSTGNFISFSQSNPQSGFAIANTGLMDRSVVLGPGKHSEVRYQTTGAAGSRIFRLEIYNAGFEDELSNYGELKDSISVQVWLYEGSNAVEFHYGASGVNNFSDYFGPQFMCGFIKNANMVTGQFDKLYVVNESGASTFLDSTTTFPGTKGLRTVPTSNTVFRFAPKGTAPTGVETSTPGTLAKVYPTQCERTLFIDHNNDLPLSYAIVNMSGQVVVQGSAPAGKAGIDLSLMAAGTYTLRLIDARASIYEGQKFTKL